jgi:predicted CXXCH cytochrome family protein
MDNLKSYKQAYPDKAYSCKACHEGAVGKATDLNSLGKALKTLPAPANPKKLTVEDYRAFEALDSDGDGATNAQELEAGTDLLDPASVPAAEPAAGSGETAAPAESPAPTPGPQSRQRDALSPVHAYLGGLLGVEAWAEEPPSVPEAHDGESAAGTAPAATYVGSETCMGCHTKEAGEFKHSTHARISIPSDGALGAQGCEMCHGPGSLHVDAGGGRGVGGIINPRKDPSTCFACHTDKKAELRLPHHHPILEGKMSCADCHNAHGTDVRPWSATTLKDINEACFKCHKEQRGPFVWEHEALREGCTSCHKVHGSIHEKMLVARDNNLCLRCHTQVNFPTIGKSNHGGRLPSGSCFSAGCHTAVHGSNFDDHLRY